MALEVYSDPKVEARLKGVLSLWKLRDGQLQRSYQVAGWKGALMVVNAIGHLAESAWHHPDLHVSYGRVGVALSTHSANGITDLDFELATRIEQLVQWQPSQEAGSLTGTPDTDQHRYIKYD